MDESPRGFPLWLLLASIFFLILLSLIAIAITNQPLRDSIIGSIANNVVVRETPFKTLFPHLNQESQRIFGVDLEFVSHIPGYEIDNRSTNQQLLKSYLDNLELLPITQVYYAAQTDTPHPQQRSVELDTIRVEFYQLKEAQEAGSVEGYTINYHSGAQTVIAENEIHAQRATLIKRVYISSSSIDKAASYSAIGDLLSEEALKAIFFGLQPGPLQDMGDPLFDYHSLVGRVTSFLAVRETISFNLHLQLPSLVFQVQAAVPVCTGYVNCGKLESDATSKVCRGGPYNGEPCDQHYDCEGSTCDYPGGTFSCNSTGKSVSCNGPGYINEDTGQCVVPGSAYQTVCGSGYNCVVSLSCGSSAWYSPAPSASPSPSPSPVPVCGDGACNGTESSATCPTDCPLGSSEWCGNGSCNSGAGENCSNCSADCGACNYCGDGVCGNSAGEACDTCIADCGECNPSTEFCGDWICNNEETCSTCEQDCGACQEISFCGDGNCVGFETCQTCERDCGVCPNVFAWWQSFGGLVGALHKTDVAIRSEVPGPECSANPACIPALMAPADASQIAETTGVAITGGGLIDANSYISLKPSADSVVIGSASNRLIENYAYFYRQFSLGLNPQEDFRSGTVAGAAASKPSYDPSKEYYFHSGDMVINSADLTQQWQVSSGERYVIFVDGSLIFHDYANLGEFVQVEEGGFLAFIASGDIIFGPSVGHENTTVTPPNVEGIFVANGTITIDDYTDETIPSRRFIGAGTFAGWSGVELPRDYLDDAVNEQRPTEQFIYRPDFIKNIPEKMRRSQTIWQETN